jgi:DNA repair protein RadC
MSKPSLAIQTLPTSERPRERCLEKGPESLSLRECLALLINSGPPGHGCLGLANQLLKLPGDGLSEGEQERAFFNAMEISGQAHLQALRGLGPSAQARVLAAFELGRRYYVRRFQENQPGKRLVDFPGQAQKQISSELRNASQEWLGFVPWYRNRGEMGPLCIVEKGVRTHVNIEPAELFARLLALRPTGFFLFHNHPGGSLEASPPDVDITLRIQEMAELLGLRFLGHGIVSPAGESWVPVKSLRLAKT